MLVNYAPVAGERPADDATITTLLGQIRSMWHDEPVGDTWGAVLWMGAHMPGVLARLARAERAELAGRLRGRTDTHRAHRSPEGLPPCL